MQPTRLVQTMATLVMMIATVALADGRSHGKTQQARVHFVATSTLLRGTWGYNEDTYLAQLQLGPRGARLLVRLVDEYSNLSAPLSAGVLRSDRGTTLRVRRDDECDLQYSSMLLRAAPGDLLALLPGKLVYQPHLDAPVDPSYVLPCFRVVHR